MIKKDYLSMKKLKRSPALADRMEHAMKRVKKGKLAEIFYAKFDLSDGKCAFFEENGLCGLQLAEGHQALPKVCRIFPRMDRYNVTGYLERSLSPACEAVLELLWNLPDGVDFRISPIAEETDKRNMSAKEPSQMLVNSFDIQDICISIVQDRRLPLPQRVILMGVKLQELLQEDININEWILKMKALLDNPEMITQYNSLSATGERSKAMFISNNLETLSEIMKTESAFREDLAAIVDSLELTPEENGQVSFDVSTYSQTEKVFMESFRDKMYFFENLAVALMFYLGIPEVSSSEKLWKSYVNFCNIYSFFRFVSVLSAKAQLPPPKLSAKTEASAPGSREALFQILTIISRALLHNQQRSSDLRDEFFKNDSSTLAHMVILVSG